MKFVSDDDDDGAGDGVDRVMTAIIGEVWAQARCSALPASML